VKSVEKLLGILGKPPMKFFSTRFAATPPNIGGREASRHILKNERIFSNTPQTQLV
jgi:hypothetical protein